MDKEMIEEYNKALRIANQYTTNIIRIRRLVSSHPLTINDGQTLANAHTGKIILGQIVKYDDTLSDYPYISLGLMR